MHNHQQKQLKVIERIERQITQNTLSFSLVSPTVNYESDQRRCLTSVHLPDDKLVRKVTRELIELLKQVEPDFYYYSPTSLHMTLKNIRVINDPPHFDDRDIEAARDVFAEVIPRHIAYRVYFYRLLLFPNNLALIGTTDPELDAIVLDLDQRMNTAGIPDDKQYANSKYFFCNMTLARFNTQPSQTFFNRVRELSEQLMFEPYTVDSVVLLTSSAILSNIDIIGTWVLKDRSSTQ